MKNNKIILVTGGAGYIGSHICVALYDAGYAPIIVDDLSNSFDDILVGIKNITGVKPDFYNLDVSDEKSLIPIFENNKIDGVIHLAAHKAVEGSVKDPIKYYANNLGCLIAILKTMNNFGVKNLVYSSSATVYAPTGAPYYVEDAPLSPINPYGWTKLMGEQMIESASSAHDIKAAILRYFNPIGAHPSGHIGENPKTNSNNLMAVLADVIAGRKKEFIICGDDYDTPDGTAIRDYVHVCDVADAHVRAMDILFNGHDNFTVNIGTGRGISVKDILSSYERIADTKIPKLFGKRRAGDAPSVCADTNLAHDTLGWSSTKTIDDMCRDFHRWMSKKA